MSQKIVNSLSYSQKDIENRKQTLIEIQTKCHTYIMMIYLQCLALVIVQDYDISGLIIGLIFCFFFT